VCFHVFHVVAATAIASSVWDAFIDNTCDKTTPLAGFSTGNVKESSDCKGRNFPPINPEC
jgi:hypothetical protein